jgi:hypothetical protein
MSKFTEYLEGTKIVSKTTKTIVLTKEETNELKGLLSPQGIIRLKEIITFPYNKDGFDYFSILRTNFFGMHLWVNFKTKEIIPTFMGEALGEISVNINKKLMDQLIDLFTKLKSLKYFKLSTKKELPNN